MAKGWTSTWRSRRARVVGWFVMSAAAMFAVVGLSSIGAEEPPVYPGTFTIGATGTTTDGTVVIAPAQNTAGMTFNNAARALTNPEDPSAPVFVPLDHLGAKTMTLSDTSVTVDADRLVITLRGTSTDTSSVLSGIEAEVLVIFAWGTADGDRSPEVSTSFKATPIGGLGDILGDADIVDGLESGPVVVTIGDGDPYSSVPVEAKPAHLSRRANLTADTVLFFQGVYFPADTYADADAVPDDRAVPGLPDPVPQLTAGSSKTMLATSLALGPLGELAHAALGVDPNSRVVLGGGLGFHLFGDPDDDGERPGIGDWDPTITEWSLSAILPSAGLPVGLDGIFENTSLQWTLELKYVAPSGSGSSTTGSTSTARGNYSLTATAALTTDLISNSDELDTIITTITLQRDPGTGAYRVSVSAILRDWQPFEVEWLPVISEVKLTGSVERTVGSNGQPGPVKFAGEFVGEVELFDEAKVRLTIGGSFAKGAFDANVSVRLIGEVGIGEIGELLTGGFVGLPPELNALRFSDLALDVRVGRTPKSGGGGGTATTTTPAASTTTVAASTTTAAASTTTVAASTTTVAASTTTAAASTTTDATTTTVPGTRPRGYDYTFKISAVGGVEIDINGVVLGARGIVIVDQNGLTIGARPTDLSLQTLLGPVVEVPPALDFALSDEDNGYSFGVILSTVDRKLDATTLSGYPVEVAKFFRPLFGIPQDATTGFEYQILGGVNGVGTFGLPAEMAGIVESLGVQSFVRLEGSVPLFGSVGFRLGAALNFRPTQPVCFEVSDERGTSDLLGDDGTGGDEEIVNVEALTTTESQLDCERGAPIDFFHAWDVAIELTGELTKTKLGAKVVGSMTLALPAGLPPEAAGPLRIGGVPVPDWKDVDDPSECGAGQTMKAFAGNPGKQRCYDLIRFGVDAEISATPEKVAIDLGAFADTAPGSFVYPFGVDWVGFGDFRVELGITYSYGSAGSVGVRVGFAGNAQLNLPLPGGGAFTKDVFVALSARLQSTTTPVPVVTVVPEGFAFSTESGIGLSDVAQIYNGLQATLAGTAGAEIPDLGPAYPQLNLRNLTFSLGLVPGGVPSLCIPFGLEITADLYWGTDYTPRGMNCDTSSSAPEPDSSHCLDDQGGGCLASLTLKIGTDGIFGDVSRKGFAIGVPTVGDVLKFDDFRFAVGLSPASQFVKFQGGAEVLIPDGPQILDAEIEATIQATSVKFLGTAEIADSAIRGLIRGSASANPFDDPLSIRFDLILAADIDGFFGGSRIQEELLEPVAEVIRVPLRLASVLAQISADYERDDSIKRLIKRLPSTFRQAGLDVPREIQFLNDYLVWFLDLIEPIEKFVNRTVDKLLNGIDFKDVVPKELRKFVPDDILDLGFPGICQIVFTDDIFDGFRKENKPDECDRSKIIPGVVVPLIERAVDDLVGFDVDLQLLLDRLAAPPEAGGLDLDTLPFDDLCLVIDVDLSVVDLDARFAAQVSAKLYGQRIGIEFEFDLSDFEFDDDPAAILDMAREILTSFALQTDPKDFSDLCAIPPELVDIAEPVPPVPTVLTSVALAPNAVFEGGELVLQGAFDRALLEPHTLRIDWGVDSDGDGANDVGLVTIPNVELGEGDDPDDLPPTTFEFVHPYVDDDPTSTPSDTINVRVADLTGVDAGVTPLELLATGRGYNLDPTISLTRLGGSAPIVEGDLVEFELVVDDPGPRDDLFVTIDWGDGEETELSFPADGVTDRSRIVSHRWADDRPSASPFDSVDVFARVVDDDTGFADTSLELEVANRDPWALEIGGARLVERVDGTPVDGVADTSTVVEGDVYEFDISFVDVLDDAHTMTIEWGDGTSTVVPAPDDPKVEVEEPDGSIVLLPDLLFSDFADIELLDAAGNVIDEFDTVTEPVYGRRTVTVTHRWLDDDPTATPIDPSNVSVEVVDDDTGTVAGELPLQVANRAPWDLVVGDATRIASFAEEPIAVVDDLVEGDRYRFDFDLTDVTADELRLEVAWGDGTSDVIDDVDASPFTTVELYPNGAAATRTVTLTHRWDDDDPTATPSDHYTIVMTVYDDDTAISTATRTFVVANVAPEIVRQGWNAAGESRDDRFDLPAPAIEELGWAVIDVELADPSRGDTHTVTVDWGDGTDDDVLTFDAVSFTDDPIDTPVFADNYVPRPFQVQHQYGDNGVFTVTFTVVDDDGMSSVSTTTVTVANVDPTLELDRSETVPAWPGPTFTTQIGVDNPFAATSYDPGSDDLTFTWDFGDGGGDVETYLVADDPDPLPSPEIDPRLITDTTSHVYVRACLYELTVDVVDDDGGAAPTERAPVVVVGLETKSRPTGWWGSRYGPLLPGKPKPFSTDEFECYLRIAEHMSSVMGEVRDVSTFDAAAAVLHGGDMPSHDARARLEGEILAAWLNYASGAVGVTADGKIDLGYMAGIYEAESTALDPTATDQALQRAHVELQALQRTHD